MRRAAVVAAVFCALVPALSACAARADSSGSLVVDGITRTYIVHLPPSYDGRTATPLVIGFHGGFGTAAGMPKISYLSDASDKFGFIVVYPQGINKHWDDGRHEAPVSAVDDVAFVNAMLDKLELSFKIDTKRVYATGISNGGFFTEYLGCADAGRIAAIASVAASMVAAVAPSCKPSRPVPVVLFHGTADPLVPYNGGPIRSPYTAPVLSAPDSAKTWAQIDGCSSSPASVVLPNPDGTPVQQLTYDGCRGDASVVLYTIQGGGHTWPDGEQYLPIAWVGVTARNLDANATMWAFFQAHPL